MAFEFLDTQLEEIASLNAAGRYADAYLRIRNWASTDGLGTAPHPEIDGAAWTWFWGAEQINRGIGPMSTFIRSYTSEQARLRFGSSLSGDAVQDASNRIAQAVLADVLASRTVPTLQSIAVNDASKTSEGIFEGDTAVWSGNVLFIPLGYDAAFRSSLLEVSGDTYDLLAAAKSTMAAAGTTGLSSVPTLAAGIWKAVSNGRGLVGSTGLFGSVFSAANSFLAAAYGGTGAALQLAYASLTADKLALGTKNDDGSLEGTTGGDYMNGWRGGDTLKSSDGNDIMDGGEGTDKADFSSASAKLTINIKDAPSTAKFIGSVTGAGIDALFGIEEIIASSQDDVVIIHKFPRDFTSLTIDGGGGDADQLSAFYLTGGVEIDTIAGTLKANGKSIDFKNFEKYEGTNEDDVFKLKGTEKEVSGRGGTKDKADFSGASGPVTIDGSGLILKDVEIIIGTSGADTIRVDQGDHQIDGGEGGDTMAGGSGNDRYDVDGGDTIEDSDGKGSVFSGGSQLTGGKKEKKGADCATNNSGDNEDVYKDDAGNEYTKSGGGLSIKLAAGGTVTITSWSDGQLGIKLKDDDSSGGGASCDPPQKKASPLVLDLDGDGIETTGLQQAPVFFDIDIDGMAERTGWVSADDGLLAIDTNNNGVIDDASELFGYGETISLTADQQLPFAQDGGIGVSFTSGFQKLALLDETRDGKIDATDTTYGQLRVWRDLNQDGVSQAAELFSLADVGVVSVNVVGQRAVSDNNGNTITDIATFRHSDGSDRQVADVWFAFDQLVSDYQRPELDAETAALPYLTGSGNVKDLRSAAAEDPALKAMLQALEALDVTDAGRLFVLTDQILQRWHGADGASAAGRGVNSDGRHVAVFEAATDTPFKQWSGSTPRPQGGAQVEAEYQLFLRNVTAKLFAQTALGQTLLPELTFENDFFLTVSPTADSATILARLVAAAPAGELEKIAYWHSMIRVLDSVYNGFADVKAAGSPVAYFNAVAAVLAGQGLSLSYDSILRAAIGGDGADTLRTKSLVSELEEASEYGRTNTVLEWVSIGGAGNDDIRLGNAKQIVYFSKGQGSDTVTGNPFEFDGWNFAPRVEVRMRGLAEADVTIERSGDYLSKDLIITILETGETLTLRDAINEATVQAALVFDGAAPVSLATIAADAIMASTDGDDRIEDVLGVNDLDGGLGDDMLIGRGGNDIYTFALGYGTDTIVEEANAGTDSIVFAPGIALADVAFERVGGRGQDLRLRIGAGGDTVIVSDQFTGAAPRIDTLVFATGETLTADDLRFFAQFGPEGDAILLGFDFIDDELFANRDAQTLTGLDGGDTYFFSAGTGDATVADRGNESADIDTVDIDAAFTDVSVARPDVDVFVFTLTGGETLTVDNRAGQIETFRFTDKTYDYAAMVAAIIQREREGDPTKVNGSTGSETLNGTPLADVINGFGGNDIVNADAGDDIINTGFGNDTINGGAGNDFIDASYGVNDVRGGTGDDVIITSDYNHIYRFDRGDGRDIILGDEGFAGVQSRIIFGAGITAADLTFRFEQVDATQYSDLFYYGADQYGLRVDIAGGTDSLLLINSDFDDVGSFNRIEFSDGSFLTRTSILNTLRTPTAADQLIVGAGSSKPADLMRGGAGTDILVGAGGNDIYGFAPGDGQDTVLTAEFVTGASVNIGGGLNALSDLAFERTGANYQDLVIRLVAAGDTLTIKNQYTDSATAQFDNTSGGYIGSYRTTAYVNTVRLADGTPVAMSAITAAFNTPTAGDDTLIGTAANDIFDGGTGNDTLVGGFGTDTYRFGRGSGNDTVVETARTLPYPFAGDFIEPVPGLRSDDRISFKDGVALSDLDIAVTGSGLQDLKITIRDTGESIEIANQVTFQSSYGTLSPDEWAAQYADTLGADPLFASGVESFALADGTIFTREQFLTFVTSRDDSGANTITTGDGGGTLDGGLGNDTLNGGAGQDTYVLAIGTGDDTASDRGGTDTLRFAAGVLPELVEFTRVGPDGDDLLIEIDGDARSAMTIKGQFDGSGNRIEKFVFPDGTTWTWQQIQEHLLQASISEQADTVLGTRGAEVIRTRGGDDLVRNLGGGDLVDGGTGWDTVELEGAATRYQVETLADRVLVTDLEDGGRVTTLVNVEAIRFRGGDGVPPQTVTFVGNTAPIAANVALAGREDTVLRINPAVLLAGATDPNGNALRILGVSAPTGGSVTVDANGTVVFTPARNTIGEARFTYTVGDAGGLTASAEAIITIAPLNDAPLAAADAGFTVGEGGTLVLSAAQLTGNDADPDNDTLTVTEVSNAVGGTVRIDVDGSVVFDAAADATGPAGFTYRIADGRGGTSEATVAITVQAVNDAPELLSNASLEVRSGGLGFGVVVATDADGDTLTYALAQGGAPVNGTVAVDPTGAYLYQPNAGFTGSDQFGVTIDDGHGQTISTIVAVTVTEPNLAPSVAAPIADQSAAPGSNWSYTLAAATFSDPNGDALQLFAFDAGGLELPAWLQFDAATQTFTGTVPVDATGFIDIAVAAFDGELEGVDVFRLNFGASNTAPELAVAIPNQSSPEDAAVSFTVPAGTFTDADGDTLALTATLAGGAALPSWLVFDATAGTFTGTPPANFNGAIDLVVTASDGQAAATAPFQLTIAPVNDAPVLAAAIPNQSSLEDAAVSFTVPAGTFADADGDTLVLTATLAGGAALPSWLVFDATAGTFTGTPPANFNGAIDLVVTASDGQAAATAPFQLTIAPVNDVAVISGTTSGTVSEDGVLTASGAITVADPDTGEAAFQPLTNQPGSYGRLTLSTAGAWSYQLDNANPAVQALNAGQSLTDTITVRSVDGTMQAITLRIDGANEPGGSTIMGTPGIDVLYGTAGDDRIEARGSSDLVFAGAGNDTLVATLNDGWDAYDGGSDSDTYDASIATTAVSINLGTYQAGFASGSQIGNDALIGIENATGGSGNDQLTGNGLANTLRGGTGADELLGRGGNDRLEGGGGNDRLQGDGGADTFVFKPGFGRDIVKDFTAGNSGTDLLELSLGASFDSFAEVLAVTTQSGTHAIIQFDAANWITLENVQRSTLNADDFRFV